MIIRAPTGLYIDVLPDDDDTGNVSFLISTTDPPRSQLRFRQFVPYIDVPAAIILTPAPRSAYGALAFTTALTVYGAVGQSGQQYAIGDVLDFLAVTIQAPAALPVDQSALTLQHDLRVIDADLMGLTATQADQLSAGATIALAQLTGQLTDLRVQQDETEVALGRTRLALNETMAALAAATVIAAASPTGTAGLVEALTTRVASLEIEIDRLGALAADLVARRVVIVDQAAIVAKYVV